MATIKYKCDTCKREIDLLEKPYNLNKFSKCTITSGCRGKFNKLSRNLDNNRESTPPSVLGLDDFKQRKVFYKHKQDLISTLWKINHGLGVSPAVEVFLDNGTTQTSIDFDQYEIIVVDKNNIVIKFSTYQKGIVHCVARSTVPEFKLTESTDVELFQVTKNAVFVFAFPKLITHYTVVPPVSPLVALPLDTQNTVRPIRLEVSITQPNQEEVICVEKITDDINNSPWLGWNEILLRKRRNYTIKTKSLFSFNQTFQLDNIKPKDIEYGTVIKFLRVDFGTGNLQPIDQDNVLILLAKTPYQAVDKIKNRVLDINAVSTSSFNYLIYQDGEVSTAEKNIESIYPDIQKVS